MSAVRSDERPQIRPMLDSDIPVIMTIENEVYEHGWSEGIFHDCLRVHYSCWVMARDEVIVGYGVISVAVGEAHILNIAIDQSEQGKGLGREFMHYLLETARHHGADTAFLEVRPSNTTALKLYDSLGFHQVGLRRDYYPAKSGREDAVIMACPLLEVEF